MRPSHPFSIAGVVCGAFARRQQRAQRGARGCVLNHSAAGARRKKFLRQSKHGDQPVEHMRFQFRARRAGRPQHPLHAQSGRKQIAKNGRARKRCKESRHRNSATASASCRAESVSRHLSAARRTARPAPEDSPATTRESLPASPATARETIRCAIGSRRSSRPRRGRGGGIRRASCGKIFRRALFSEDSPEN